MKKGSSHRVISFSKTLYAFVLFCYFKAFDIWLEPNCATTKANYLMLEALLVGNKLSPPLNQIAKGQRNDGQLKKRGIFIIKYFARK